MNTGSIYAGPRRHLRRVADAAVRLVFPRQCATCDAYLKASSSFCERCEYAVFRLNEPQCGVCGEPGQANLDVDLDGVSICGRCAERRPQFARARAFWEYSGSVSDAIQRAKYGKRLWIVRNLAAALGPWFRAEVERISRELCADEFREGGSPIQMTCVPMHPKDLRARGFNLANLLLRACQKSAGFAPDVANLLVKTRRTSSQAALGHLDRQINLRQAFSCAPRASISGQPVLLFDDVLTTGATAHEVAKTLRRAGASRVFVLSAARALAR